MNRKGFGSKSLSMSGSSFQFDVSESQRRENLQQKLMTIDKQLISLRSSSSAVSSAPRRADASYTIDYMSPQITSCPHCFENMPARDLRKHMAKFCKDKMVTCTEIGCDLVLPQGELKKHLAHGCMVARQRRAMATTAIKRKEMERETHLANMEALSMAHRAVPPDISRMDNPASDFANSYDAVETEGTFDATTISRAIPREEFTNCDACQERVRADDMRNHTKGICRMRPVYCSNRHLGCLDEVPLALVSKHLRCDCLVEKRKDQLVAKSRQRYEKVKCTGCADMVPLMYLKKHEVEECPNRKVPCRNHLLGCQVMVRMKDRKNHEDVDSSVKPRSCLFFDGCDTVMQLDEDDIPPPWTVEFWIYRPSLLESARSYMREVRRLGELFLHTVFHECRTKAKIMDIKETLRVLAEDTAKAAAKSAMKKGGRTDTLLPQSDLAELTVQLAGMIQGYEDAAAESLKISQLYVVAITAAKAEIETAMGIRDHKELLDFQSEVDGVPCRESYKEKSVLVADTGAVTDNTPADSKTGSRVVSRCTSTANSEQSPWGVSDDSCSPPVGEGLNDEVILAKSDLDPTENVEVAGDDVFVEADGEFCVGGDVELEADMVDIPPGYERIITNPRDFDWGPKLWKEWRNMMSDMLLRLASDQEVMRELRIESGLVRENKKEKKKKKVSDGEENADEGEGTGKEKKEKKSKREKKEKKRKIDKSLKGESRFTEVAAAVKNLYQGSETLCFSDNAAIYLNMSNAIGSSGSGEDIQGQVGFSDALLGETSFNMNIVREQWTHVAIMCTVEPKKRILLYCDGGLVSTVKDITFDLPMKSIGSPHLSLHGYMLDCRYWAKSRSVPEVKLDMRCLLKLSEENKQSNPLKKESEAAKSSDDELVPTSSEPDLTGDGLVAWWTFEDGGFSKRVRDVSDHRFPTLITGGITGLVSRKTPWFEAGSMLPLTVREHLLATSLMPPGQRPPPVITPQITIPLPSYLERNLCPFEVRRAKLAQRGRALLQEKKCPNSCYMRVRKTDMRFHVKFECPRRRIQCRHHWCSATFFAEDIREHETHDCALVVRRDAIIERAADNMTVLQCTDCSAKIQARNMMRHMEQSCPYRVISCPHSDCDEEFPAHLKRKHLNYMCKSEAVSKKKWLVRRARERLNYPRPWGIELAYSSTGDEAADEDIEREVNGQQDEE